MYTFAIAFHHKENFLCDRHFQKHRHHHPSVERQHRHRYPGHARCNQKQRPLGKDSGLVVRWGYEGQIRGLSSCLIAEKLSIFSYKKNCKIVHNSLAVCPLYLIDTPLTKRSLNYCSLKIFN